MLEMWKSIVGYEGCYAVSNFGRVKSCYTGKIKSILGNKRDPYKRVCLHKNGTRTNPTVHRLVLEAFRGVRPKGMEARHLDGDASNNRLDNLVWSSHVENESDKVKHRTTNRKPVIRSDGKRYESATEAAKDVSRHQSDVTKVCQGINKTCAGYGWQYA